MKFDHDYKVLETVIRTILYSKDKDNMHQIITNEGETLNLLNSGTLMIQASQEVKRKFKSDFKHYMNYKNDELDVEKRLFIIHDNESVKKQLEKLLHNQNITHFTLSNYKEKDFNDIKQELFHCKTGIILITENNDSLLKKINIKVKNMVPILGKNNIIVLAKDEIFTNKKLCKDMCHIAFKDDIKEALPKLTVKLDNLGFK